jgi:hypothetical protein
MQYSSPFSIFGIDLNNTESLNPGLLKKKMMAEFELSNAVTINTPAGEFSKHDILELLEQLKDTQTLNYHKEIALDKNLLQFLETEKITGIFANNPIYDNDNFLSFISPYFAYSYCNIVCNHLESLNNSQINISKIPVLILQNQKNELLRPINRKIASIIQEIKLFSKDVKNRNINLNDNLIEHLFGFHIIKVFNQLDPQFFEADIEQYAKCCLDIIDECVNEKRTGFINAEFVNYLLSRLNVLNTSSEIKEFINRFTTFNKKVTQNNNRKEKSGVPRLIYIIAIVVFALIRITHNCGRNHVHYKIDTPDLSSLNTVEYNDSTIYLRIFNDVAFSFWLNNRIKKEYSTENVTLKTGDNPIPNLTPINSDTSSNQYKLILRNYSDLEAVALINTKEGNIYTFIDKKSNITLGIPSEKINLVIMTGKNWDINYYVERARISGKEGNIKTFTGGFEQLPEDKRTPCKFYKVIMNSIRNKNFNIVIPEFKITQNNGKISIENNTETVARETEFSGNRDSVSKRPMFH